jgi:Ca2+-binding EF-hand superfamily protein
MKSSHPHILKLALVAMLGAFACAPAMAAEDRPNFKAYDSNGDNAVSLAEFKAQGGQEEAFRSIDTDGNSSLSSDELGKAGMPKASDAKPY